MLSTLWTVRSLFSGFEVRLKAAALTLSQTGVSPCFVKPELNGSHRLSVDDHVMHA